MLDYIESGERNISFCNRFPEASYVFVLDKEAICEYVIPKRDISGISFYWVSNL
jgi:hypothetical protein